MVFFSTRSARRSHGVNNPKRLRNALLLISASCVTIICLAARRQSTHEAFAPHAAQHSTPSQPDQQHGLESLKKQSDARALASDETTQGRLERRRALGGFAGGVASIVAGGSIGPTASRAASSVAPSPVDSILPPWLAASSGAVQGAAQNLVKQAVLHPFDTVKTRVQSAVPVPRSELFRGLYRGFLPTIVSGTPGSSVFFAAKELATATLKTQLAPAPLPTLGGVVAGVLTAKAIKTPFDVAETRAMADTSNDTEGLAWDGSWTAAQKVYKAEGLSGLYRGYGANVAYKLPADAAKFLAYEALRAGGADTIWSPAVAGAVSTLVANAVTTPLDVVRTRVMVNSTEGGDSGSVIGTFQSILAKEDAAQQLFSGLGWRLARGVVAGAIQFSVLEKTKDVVEGRR